MLSFRTTARTAMSLTAVFFMAASLTLNAQDKPAENKVKKEIKKEKVVKAVKEDAGKGCACCSGKEAAHKGEGKMEHGKTGHAGMKHEKMNCADKKHDVSCTVTLKDDGETMTEETTTTTKDGRVEKKIIKKRVIKNEAGEADDCCAGTEGKEEKTSAVKTDKPWNAVCPVLGNKVDASGPTVTYNGKVYAFCCPGCDTKFKADPEKYSRNLSEDGKKFLN